MVGAGPSGRREAIPLKLIDFDAIKAAHPLARYCEARGISLRRSSGLLVGACPLHEDSTPVLRSIRTSMRFVLGATGMAMSLTSKLHCGEEPSRRQLPDLVVMVPFFLPGPRRSSRNAQEKSGYRRLRNLQKRIWRLCPRLGQLTLRLWRSRPSADSSGSLTMNETGAAGCTPIRDASAVFGAG